MDFVRGGQPPLGIGIAAKADEIVHGQACGHVIFLPQDGQAPRQDIAGGFGHVQPIDGHAALVHAHQAADHREQCRFASAVRSDDRGDATLGQVERDPVDHAAVAVTLGNLVGDDHRADLRKTRNMNTMPPRNSMMIESAVSKANARSNRVWPPTRQMTASSTEAGSTYLCRLLPTRECARVATSRPKKVIGPTRAVETDTRTAMSTRMVTTVRW